jgi:oxygen-dependent protoporphyrinogen oxidase
MVVNLYYCDPNILPKRGFGYLIPRSISFDQNPECALGVVFDSDAVRGQDTVPGTKVTVMLGGHWWDGFDSYPDEAEGAAMAKAVLKRHLKIDEEPAAVNVSLQKDCIPQYTVGHEARMKAAHGELMQMFKGKLAVAGNSYTGVGLNDCVRAARDVVMDIKDRQATGLESFVGGNPWVTKTFLSKAEGEEMLRRGSPPT